VGARPRQDNRRAKSRQAAAEPRFSRHWKLWPIKPRNAIGTLKKGFRAKLPLQQRTPRPSRFTARPLTPTRSAVISRFDIDATGQEECLRFLFRPAKIGDDTSRSHKSKRNYWHRYRVNRGTPYVGEVWQRRTMTHLGRERTPAPAVAHGKEIKSPDAFSA
jgi:hypothetical protein